MTVVYARPSWQSTRGTNPNLRGEEHKAELSGPVRTYKAEEEFAEAWLRDVFAKVRGEA